MHRSIHRDQTIYVRPNAALHTPSLTIVIQQGKDADDFNPDRFIDGGGKLRPPVPDTRDGTSSCCCTLPTLIFPSSSPSIEGEGSLKIGRYRA
jgi:hypothetical protein